MSKPRVLSVIRKQAYYRPMLRTLEQNGVTKYEIQPPTGCGHPMLVFVLNGAKIRMPLPTSPSGGSRAAIYIPSYLRRIFRSAARRQEAKS